MNSYSLKDIWLRAVGISILSGLSLMIDGVFQQPFTGATWTLIVLDIASVALTWHLNRVVITYFRTALRERMKTARRLVITSVLCISANTAFALLVDAIRYRAIPDLLTDARPLSSSFHLSFGNTVFTLNALGLEIIHASLITTFFLTVYELLFHRQDLALYQQQLEHSEQEREKLRVANLQSQLDVLKQQVNPHFLFNSLNSLSSLISEDPKQAEQFVDKLSGVYRYVLRANEQQLTTMETELRFIDSYYHLLQTRYGTGLNLTIAVDDRYLNCQLPPLTLQLLIENAVKHNVVAPRKPLTIQIGIDEQHRLVVQNTLQRKVTHIMSNGVGLTNIVAKYQMLKLPQPVVEESEALFTVRLPLLDGRDAGY
ncbi:sensor histidine kinase [Larkinella bovis]|uniref:Sensor histidine kinase n=1 Tax=Larkinella bovis TaxID=683041 RepID=A0ABW0IAQ1_9BACT